METKPFYATSEFWGLVALSIANLLGAFNVSGKWQGILQTAITGLYAISRGLAKSGVTPTSYAAHDPELDDPNFAGVTK